MDVFSGVTIIEDSSDVVRRVFCFWFALGSWDCVVDGRLAR